MKQRYTELDWSRIFIICNLEKKSIFYLLQPNCALPFQKTSQKHWAELTHLYVCNFHSPSLSNDNQNCAMLPANHLLQLPKTEKERRGKSYKLQMLVLKLSMISALDIKSSIIAKFFGAAATTTVLTIQTPFEHVLWHFLYCRIHYISHNLHPDDVFHSWAQLSLKP